MTDRELLELAAKAYGLHGFHYYHFAPPGFPAVEGIVYYIRENGENVTKFWSPLTDDGDALRLAVKLNMCLGLCEARAVACQISIHEEPHGIDPFAATRRAIVRAAAEIGKTL